MPRGAGDGLELESGCGVLQRVQLNRQEPFLNLVRMPEFARVCWIPAGFRLETKEMLEPHSAFLDWHLQPQ